MVFALTFEERLERGLAAIASGERRALLDRLLEVSIVGEPGHTITELAAALGTSRFTASRHLGVLRAAGLVLVDSVGTRRPHRLDLRRIAELDDWLAPFVDAHLSDEARRTEESIA